MKFTEESIEALDVSDPESLRVLLVDKLSGAKGAPLDEQGRVRAKQLIDGSNGQFDHARLNELLLLLDEDRIGESFYDFFFKEKQIELQNLKQGIIDFRGYSMLAFGSFRFGRERLAHATREEIRNLLLPHSSDPDSLRSEFQARLPRALEIDKIPQNETWYCGYVARQIYERDAKLLESLLADAPEDRLRELVGLEELYKTMGDSVVRVQRTARENTDIYLSWDHLDVYIATSMRRRWEFEDTAQFLEELFVDRRIEPLQLRYFDPTQSLCANRIDKGLVEGLMLKRARCTIYMAQEVDSMGKDSELAATLAQGKPVIAYVPAVSDGEYKEKLDDYSLDYLERRLRVLGAEGVLYNSRCVPELRKIDTNYESVIDDFLGEVLGYRELQPLVLWESKEDEFKSSLGEKFKTICAILAAAEHFDYENRADVLARRHPLALQVDLNTGVANGVLVVRSSEECAELLQRVLCNELEFSIKHQVEEGAGVTVLEETVSKCPFRVVTDHTKLTNSFWNFWGEREAP